jgi:hypothetical protein
MPIEQIILLAAGCFVIGLVVGMVTTIVVSYEGDDEDVQ